MKCVATSYHITVRCTPVVHEMYSPYSAFDNNPIYYVDPSGANSENEDKSDLNDKKKAAVTGAAEGAVKHVKDTYDKNGSCGAQCNRGVNHVFTTLTGSNELKGLKANEIYDKLPNSDNFEEVEFTEVLDLANKGEVIIGAWKAKSGSGHVVMAVPGSKGSGTWDYEKSSKIPQVMDTGSGMRSSKQGANNSYGKAKQGVVLLFIWFLKIKT